MLRSTFRFTLMEKCKCSRGWEHYKPTACPANFAYEF